MGSLRKGIPIELVASNARTSTDMIRRFYGSHIDNILETGTVYVEKEKERRDKRFNLYNQVVADLRRVSNDPMYDTSAEREEAAQVAELIKIRQEAAKGDGGKEREQKAKKIVRRKSRSSDDEI